MIYALIFGLGIFAIIAYIMSGGRILSVGFLTNIMFIVSSVILLLRVDAWNMHISGNTVAVILFGNFAVMAGEWLTLVVFSRRKKRDFPDHIPNMTVRFSIPRKTCKKVIILMLVMCLLFFAIVMQTIRDSGYGSSLYGLMAYRKASSEGENNYSIVTTIISLISKVICYIFAFVCCYSKIIQKEKLKIRYIAPVVLYLLITFMSSARFGFLVFGAGIFFIVCFLIENKYKKKKANFKLIKYGVLIFAIVIAAFWFAGMATGKTGGEHKFIDIMVVYGGSPIYALDHYINHNGVIGQINPSETLFGISNILKKLGFKGFTGNRNLEAIVLYAANGELETTNVYTCYRSLLHDYGYIGTFIIRFLFGTFYTGIILSINRSRSYPQYKKIVVFSSIFYPVLLQGIRETWIKEIPTITMFLTVFLLGFLMDCMFGHKKVKFKIIRK